MTNKELFIKCAMDSGIKVADNAMTIVNNYIQATSFFTALKMNHVHLGMDMVTGVCSGTVDIEGVPTKHICLIEKDNGTLDYFKFKNMLILYNDLNDPESVPEIFIEADYDEEWLGEYAAVGYKYPGEGRYLGLEEIPEQTVVYNKESVELCLRNAQEGYYNLSQGPMLRCIIRNTRRERLVYINVQEGKKRHQGNMILYRTRDCTFEEFMELFSNLYSVV